MNPAPLALLVALALAVAPGGCGARVTSAAGRRPADGRLAAGSDALSLRLTRLAGALAAHGFTPAGDGGYGFLLEGDGATHPIGLRRGDCLTILAVGSVGVRDLDAQLHSTDGTELAEDDEPDAHPIVQTCASAPARVYYVLKMFAGSGAYRFIVLRSSRSAQGHAVTLVRAGAQVPRSRAPLDARLEARAHELAARGFSSRGEPIAATLGRHEAVRVALPVERGGCYTVLALGGQGLLDVDLVLLDEDAVELARDTSRGPEAETQICVEAEEILSAEVRAVGGAGELRFAVLGAANEAVGGAGRLWIGERRDRPSDVPLPRAVADTEQRLRQDGFALRPTAPASRIQQHEVQSHAVQTRAASCTAVVAVGGRGLGRMRLTAFDAEGDPIADVVEAVGRASLRLCPGRTVLARVDVEPLRGWGEVAIVVGDAPPAAAVRGARALLASRLAALLDESTGAGWTVSGAPLGGHVPAGGLRQHPGSSDARCLRWIAAADGRDPDLRLFLLDRAGRRLSVDRSTGGSTSIELCAAPGEAATVELRVDADTEYRLVRLEKN